MSQHDTVTGTDKTNTRNGLTTGLILVGIGIGLLIFQFANLALYFPLALGLIFLTAGSLASKPGLIIPGGIIGGVGFGVLATQMNWLPPAGTPAGGGVFLIAFSLGWFLIPLFSKLFTQETQIWALIPGAVMALLGGLLLAGQSGLRVLELAGKFWPVILVVIGLGIIFGWWKERK